MNNFLKTFLTDLKVELMDEFDKNFERKAFFDRSWKQAKFINKRGSLMMRSGTLRRSLRAQVEGDTIRFYSAMPYASIQNEGGTLTVTKKMKRFFWAMYYKATGGIRYDVKTKSAIYNKRAQRLSLEASQWKALALKPIGSKIKIEARPFIGHHPQVDASVKRVMDAHFKDIENYVHNLLKPKQ